jgi:hypothetical protein
MGAQIDALPWDAPVEGVCVLGATGVVAELMADTPPFLCPWRPARDN